MDKTSKSFPVMVMTISFASLAVVCWVDYVTAYDLQLQVFYFIPVSLCGWYLDRRLVIGMVVLSGIAWGFVDSMSGHFYATQLYRYWNIGVCFASLLILGLVLHQLRLNLDKQKKAKKELEEAFEKLKLSSAEIGKLRDHLQVFCAWSKRIKVEGKWMSMEEFLTDHLQISITHGMDPEIMQELQREFDGKSSDMPGPL